MLDKKVARIVMVVHSKEDSVLSFLERLSNSLHVSIEPILAATCMCLSYGFYDDSVQKKLLLLDFGWNTTRVQIVNNCGNVYRFESSYTCKSLSGRSLFVDLCNTMDEQLVVIFIYSEG